MAFNVAGEASLTTNETVPVAVSKIISALGLSAKVLVDESLGPAPATFDLAPHVASIAAPKLALLVCDGDGAKIKLDGAAAFSAKAYKVVLLELAATPSGVLDLELDLQGVAAQRVQFFVLGD
jgi:hypothetical protein